MSKRSLCATFCLSLLVACGGSDDGGGNPSTEAMLPDGNEMEPSPDSMGSDTPNPSSTPGSMTPQTPSPGAAGGPSVAPDPTNTATPMTPEPAPEVEPTMEPTVEPTAEPTMEPAAEPTMEPTAEPTMEPTAEPTMEPTAEPTMEPTVEPTMEPTMTPDASGCLVWMDPDGDDGNDGSAESPVQSLLVAYELTCPSPGVGIANGTECVTTEPRVICVKPGTYMPTERLEFRKTRMGSAENPIILQGDPSSTERPLFDFSNQERLTCGANPDNIGGFTVNADYVTIRNIVVTGANDNCILVQGSYGLVENVLTYECADTGIQISAGSGFDNSGTNNTVRNCDSHSNYDVQCEGENADGFAIKEGTGAGNSFIGCRAWNNTDDGFDLYAWTSTVHIENSWAFDQCQSTEDAGSDCNGFKLGGDDVSATHELVDLIAVGNSRATGNGFTENSNPASLSCSGTCASWGNVVDVDSVSGVDTTPIGNANVTNMAADSARNSDGSLKDVSEL